MEIEEEERCSKDLTEMRAPRADLVEQGVRRLL